MTKPYLEFGDVMNFPKPELFNDLEISASLNQLTWKWSLMQTIDYGVAGTPEEHGQDD